MKLSTAKLYIEATNMYPPVIKNRCSGWVIELHVLNTIPRKRHPLLSNDRGKTRVFKTLDSAYRVCRSLGYKNIDIIG